MITGFKICGYKGFSDIGAEIYPLSTCNVFIGANNSGKTNILEALDFFSNKISWPQSSDQEVTMDWSSLTEFHKHGNSAITLTVYFSFNTEQDDLTDNEKDLVAKIKKPYATYTFKKTGKGKASFKLTDSFLHNLPEDIIRKYVQRAKGPSGGSLDDRKVDAIKLFNVLKYSHIPRVLFLSEKRRIHGNEKIRNELYSIINPDYTQRSLSVEKEDHINKFIRSALGDGFNIKVPGAEIEIIQDDFQGPISSYGAGVAEILYLAIQLSKLTKPMFVCIDEPETHLHPTAQRQLLTYLNKQTPHTYFFATHSNNLLDHSIEKSIYRVTKTEGQSTLYPCTKVKEQREILDDLGIRASEILQSNGIIWVEGPSDRIYIKKWIELLNPDLAEGTNYTFQFYGGSILNWFGIEDSEQEDLINMLKTNRNSYIVMDSDEEAPYETKDLNKTKQRIIEECTENQTGYWVTQGRTIENYMDNILIKEITNEDVNVDLFTWYRQENILLPFFSKKVAFAKKAVTKMTNDFLKRQLDLSKKMHDLLERIDQWNN